MKAFQLDRAGKTVIIRNNAFTGCELGVAVFHVAAGTQILTNLIYGCDGNTSDYPGGISLYAAEQVRIRYNTILNNVKEDGILMSACIAADVAFNVIAQNGFCGIRSYSSFDTSIVRNTIGECTLDNSLFTLDALDLPFIDPADLAAQVGGSLNGRDFDANRYSAVYLKDDYPAMAAEPADYEWIEVNTSNADYWTTGEYGYQDFKSVGQENPEGGYSIGFDFPITRSVSGDVYTEFNMDSHGGIELGRASGALTLASSSMGRAGYIEQNFSSSWVFANAGWLGLSEPPVYETHNGEQVAMNGYGFRYFAGDGTETDGDGNTVVEECLVIRYYMNSAADLEADPDNPLWMDFQAVLYPDGRIRWNTKTNDSLSAPYGAYNGAWAGANDAPFEIAACSNPESGTSYLYDPTRARAATSQIAGNTMDDNVSAYEGAYYEDSIISLMNAYEVLIRSNHMSCFEGMALFQTELAGSNLGTTMVFNTIWPYYYGSNEGYQVLYNNSGGALDARYNYWGHDVFDDDFDLTHYIVNDGTGDVLVDPWLGAAVPDPDDSGILLYEPFNVNSDGTVITVTYGIYQNLVMVIPLGSVDYQEEEEPAENKAAVVSPDGIAFTVGELLPIPDNLPSYIDGVGIPFILTPTGQEFNSPVTITLPYTGYTPPNNVFYYDTALGEWSTDGITVLSVDESARTITFTAEHFTVFAAGLTKSSSGTEDDPEFHYHRREWGDDFGLDCFIAGASAPDASWLAFLALLMLCIPCLKKGMLRK